MTHVVFACEFPATITQHSSSGSRFCEMGCQAKSYLREYRGERLVLAHHSLTPYGRFRADSCRTEQIAPAEECSQRILAPKLAPNTLGHVITKGQTARSVQENFLGIAGTMGWAGIARDRGSRISKPPPSASRPQLRIFARLPGNPQSGWHSCLSSPPASSLQAQNTESFSVNRDITRPGGVACKLVSFGAAFVTAGATRGTRSCRCTARQEIALR